MIYIHGGGSIRHRAQTHGRQKSVSFSKGAGDTGDTGDTGERSWGFVQPFKSEPIDWFIFRFVFSPETHTVVRTPVLGRHSFTQIGR